METIGWDDGRCCGRCALAIENIFALVSRDDGSFKVEPRIHDALVASTPCQLATV